MNCISQPIIIKRNKYEVGGSSVGHNKTSSSSQHHQYGLKQNSFNPNKSSPPSSWNFRLMQRICKANETTSFYLASSNDVNAQ